ncbi:hypothetical protein HELRODRAFT_94516 [Helobdella robusta]|uniref:Nucleolar protein 58 n=1 Tax=Helobdella robusta TaxID=6412 RepID=T1G916_HELRO|nr:hypothetical protein HELRODRAFT_94516 [Helobdella robusta]ESO02342.1 hypothetical protein HELRODRAFT_94516 [Helobdella robusta]
MLVLFETAAGYAIFQLLDEKKLKNIDKLYENFESAQSANDMLKLKQFSKFKDTTEALGAVAATIEGKMSKPLKKLMKKLVCEEVQEELAVSDAKLGSLIKERFKIQCVANNQIQELMRCIRSQSESLLAGLPSSEMSVMVLGLAHSLSRYKLKFSPDKVDTMIIQAVGLLDDLDKELNNYVMRVREWYGWHFPELGKLIGDNLAFVKTVQKMGLKTNAATCDLSDILPEELEQELKNQAEISMGSEISEDDITQIRELCEEVVGLTDYRSQLYDYLKNRMLAVAPNLTVLVGELVGARLISHAGSLVNLAKHPASTVQILGAEKALFRALKTKHDTPKYGLIYHASMVGQTSQKNKGKISRMLAAKAALAIRVDALGEDGGIEMAMQAKSKLETMLKFMEEGHMRKISGSGKAKAKFDKYENKSTIWTNQSTTASTLPKKRKLIEEIPTPESSTTPGKVHEESSEPKRKKMKQEVEAAKQKVELPQSTSTTTPAKKKKDKQATEQEMDTSVATTSAKVDGESSEKKKKKDKQAAEQEMDASVATTPAKVDGESGEKKKKKKDKQAAEQKMDASVATTPAKVDGESSEKKKKKKDKQAAEQKMDASVATTPAKVDGESGEKKKKKKDKQAAEQEMTIQSTPTTPAKVDGESGEKKKKKKDKQAAEQEMDASVVTTPAKVDGESGEKKKKKKDKQAAEQEMTIQSTPTTPAKLDGESGESKKKKKKEKKTEENVD